MRKYLIFPPKTARDPRQRDMVASFWTATTAWFKGGTGPNSEDSPCPSVTFYWCCAEGFYSTVFEHRTPLGKPLSGPSASNHNFLSNSSWGAWQSRWWHIHCHAKDIIHPDSVHQSIYCMHFVFFDATNSVTNLVNVLQHGFWENDFEIRIYCPLWRLLR